MSTANHDPEFGGAVSKPRRPRWGLSRIEIVVASGVVVMVVLLLLPGGHEVSRRSQCVNNMKMIGLALHNYVSQYDALPPAYSVDANGKPLHSWRTLILPFIEQENLYKTIDLSKPWDDPVNSTAAATGLVVYMCPEVALNLASRNMTTYHANVGPDGFLAADRSRRLDDITDGLATTLAVIEASTEDAVPWMAPVDHGAVALMKLSPKEKPPHAQGANALLANGGVKLLKADTSDKMRRALLTISGKDNAAVDFP